MTISALSRLGLAKEAQWGTPVVASKFLPVKDFKPTDDIKMIIDEGIRGVAAKDFGAYAGTRLGQLEYGGDFYPDVAPFFILGILGKDTVSGSAPYTHLFQLDPNPPSFTIEDYNGNNSRQFAGAMISELGLKFATDSGALEHTLKLMSKASTVLGSPTTATYGTIAPLLGWQAALTVGGSAVDGRLLAFELNLKRTLKEMFGANNSQDPSKIHAGILEVTGKMTFDMPDDNELEHYLLNDQPAIAVTLSNGGAGAALTSIVFTLTKCLFEKANSDRSQEHVRLDAQIRGIYNTTDAGPVAITVKNAVASY